MTSLMSKPWFLKSYSKNTMNYWALCIFISIYLWRYSYIIIYQYGKNLLFIYPHCMFAIFWIIAHVYIKLGSIVKKVIIMNKMCCHCRISKAWNSFQGLDPSGSSPVLMSKAVFKSEPSVLKNKCALCGNRAIRPDMPVWDGRLNCSSGTDWL